jgi:hypothetical protein
VTVQIAVVVVPDRELNEFGNIQIPDGRQYAGTRRAYGTQLAEISTSHCVGGSGPQGRNGGSLLLSVFLRTGGSFVTHDPE